ncbi:translation initiation factor IF-2 [Rhizobium sp. BK619]|uniref:Translation initiation factor IF-2 n=3 Tax=Rhizobium leguminosarum TaxID=384 RepID=A0ABF7QTP0_RHILW|nr:MULTISPECIES: translation initiation factor IF-2 [Rhizobium]ACI57329.1 translation initiation factor IF-2 [Rhizobium leguminosarum bv. trifolii WSM2304]EJB04774.1 translation initiation factor IF-2 [Rhizobium leguminosarum bv. trifolii WSM597]MBB3645074.1 translation initiation factor IF-2 [Rhizobium sp. BK619]MBB6221890.1 translation initiation factor IF-2 [Rhizobium leguminosarum]
MTDSNDDKTISVTGKKTLSLKPSGMSQGTVRQDMGRGRTKAVVVETRKRRPMRPEDEKPITPAAPVAPVRAAEPAPAPVQARPQQPTPAPRIQQGNNNSQTNQRPQQSHQSPRQNDRPRPVVLNHLSPEEMDARRRALADAQARDAQDAIRRAEDEKRRAAEEVVRKAAEAEEAARRAAEEAIRQAEAPAVVAEPAAAAAAPAEARADAPQQPASSAPAARRPDAAGAPAAARPAAGAAVPGAVRGRRDEKEEEDRGAARGGPVRGRVVRPEPAKPVTTRPKTDEERRRGKLTISTANVDGDDNARGRSLSAMRRRQEKFRRGQMQETREKISREVVLPETITIQELSQRMSERAVDVIKYLMKEGQMMKPGDVIDADLAELIASEFGHTVRRVSESDVELGIFNVSDEDGELVSRPPVVTIMGHVDHGKTSLLDAIRHANVVSGEAGGITQHIGAYQVEQSGQKITFIDTPGHAAFTAMRARGAQATDIAILVVAADDSVMPQTIESINHAKAAGVPIIVAINKVDKHEADPQKVRNQLLQHEVFVESMGGEVLDVEVSAKTGKNLDKLLEAILLQAEILDLKANPNRTAEGTVIEAQLDRGRGSVATVLVQKGTLRPGQIIVAGDVWGRVRALVTDKGDHVKEAGPATPVEVLGLSGTPQAGDKFAVVESESRAREISEYRQRLARDKAAARQSGQRGSLEQMMMQRQSAGIKEFPLVIKGDVQGSIEAIAGALEKLGTDEVRARIVHSGAGGITESDISLAEASNAAIIGFNVRANTQARQFAEREGIEIRYYNIIYDLVDDVKAAMSGLLSPERRETFIGNAEILEVFNITKVGKVAGCRVVEGKVERGAGVRLIRNDVVVHEGKLKTLKRFKDEVSEVPMGQECGMAFENYEDMRAGDVIECFRVEHITRTL